MARHWTENLNICVKNGEVEGVKKALAKGGRVDGGHTTLKSPLHYAAQAGYVEIARLLCDHKADLELRSKLDEGGTALVLAVKAGHKATVNLLLQRGADAQILDDNGESVAQHASRGGHTAILEQLWKHNSLLTSPEQYGANTLLHLAAEYGHLDTVKWLVSHGHSPSCLDREKRTPADRGRAHHKVYTWLKTYQTSNILVSHWRSFLHIITLV
ncbi:hypothetical protein OTU49_010195 [Cherax quadricarinatus]|uniref:Uncharacterized protein n=1 Tax=Cherax quadricarinatus TaxID=27406 RepID=A0AAW0YJW1_CHEQU